MTRLFESSEHLKAWRAGKVKRVKKKTLPEAEIQKAIVQFLEYVRNRGDFRFLHVPNGGHMSPAMGARRKRMGAKAGVPDLLIQKAGGGLIEVEVKAPGGRLSKSQRAWREESKRLGIAYYVVRSVEEMEKVLREEEVL